MPDSPEIGPGGLQLVDLGGCGDCAYRCIAYGLTYLSANGFVNDPAAEDEAKTKVKELGLRMQAMTNNTSWQEFWAPDESAAECSEAGAVPGNLEQFKDALQREQRWACGLTLQAISNIHEVNLIAFEDKANQWIRTGFITCVDGASTKARTFVLALYEGHYYLVKALHVDANWLGKGLFVAARLKDLEATSQEVALLRDGRLARFLLLALRSCASLVPLFPLRESQPQRL